MNLNDYRVISRPDGGFTLVHLAPDHTQRLLFTENVGLDTLLRVALDYDLDRTFNG